MSKLVTTEPLATRWADYVPILNRIALAGLIATIIGVSFQVFYFSDLHALVASIQDDSFYYLVPAFNFAHGRGFSFGGILSYGFEPGYEIALTILAPFFNSIDIFFRSALFLNSILFTFTGTLIYFATKDALRLLDVENKCDSARSVAALGAAAVYLSNYWNYFNSTTGKENPLAALLLAGSIVLTLRDRNTNQLASSIGTGFLAGLLALTRPVPATLLYIGSLAFVHRRHATAFMIGGTAAVLPWIVFAWIYFGNPLPYSALVKSFAPSHPIDAGLVLGVAKYVTTTLRFGSWGPSMIQLPQPNWSFALSNRAIGNLLYLWLAVSAVLFSRQIWKLRPSADSQALLLPLHFAALLVGAAVTGAAVLIKRPGEAFYASWYFYDSPVLLSILMGIGVHLVTSIWSRPTARRAFTTLVASPLLIIYVFGASIHYFALKPYTSEDFAIGIGKRWQNTMIAAALWYRNHTPDWENNSVAAASAGALNFMLHDRVINLDGLSNNDAARYILDGKGITSYLQRVKPNYLIDERNFVAQIVPHNASVQQLYLLPLTGRSGYTISRLQFSQSRTER
jgi:hypothetical protein